MTSSCVPPKMPCVMHDPDPGNNGTHDRDGDTDSECGSLCTCTSSSMTSLATSVANCNHPNGRVSRLAGSSVSLVEPQATQQTVVGAVLPANPVAASGAAGHAATDANGNPYIVVFVPPTMLPGREGNCGSCQGQGALQTAFKTSLVTACEFCPWVAGFVFIYYAFYWWGIGPGFSAFLFMMGSHALIRFFRARGEAGCNPMSLSRVRQSNPDTPEEEAGEEDADEDDEGEDNSRDASPETVNENPPSYEVAVVKPPPYDLYYHLTPTQPRSQIQQTSKQHLSENFLTVPEFAAGKKVPEPNGEDGDDDLFLPSYQDAIRLSFRSEKEMDPPADDGEES